MKGSDKMDLQKYIGSQIRTLRNGRGIDMDRLAELLDTTKQSISRYERGDRQVNQDMLFRLSEIFGVGIDYFFPTKDNIVKLPTQSNYEYMPIPVAAGEPSTIEATAPEQISVSDAIMGKYAGNEDVFFVRINGDSMNKVIPHESLIAVKRIEIEELCNDDIVVFSNGHEYSVKRYYDDTENKRLVFGAESTDRSFIDHIVPYEECENLVIHGKVVMYIVSP